MTIRQTRSSIYGNDIGSGNTYNTPESATNSANYDSINNVQNVFISASAGQRIIP